MEDSTETTTIHNAASFQIYLNKLIQDQQYEQVAQLFTSAGCEKYFAFIQQIGSDLYRDVCLPALNKQTYDSSLPHYACADELLKIIAQHGSREELLLELLELVEECNSEHVFSSALHALQIVLLRLADSKPLAWQWALNSVHTFLTSLELPEIAVYNEKTMALLEQEQSVQTILTHYVTVGLFYTPLLDQCLNTSSLPNLVFRDNSLTRRNIFCAFFIQLLDKPMALLQLSTSATQPGSNAYTRQVTRQLVLSAVKCLKADPLYLLQYLEERCRYKRLLDSKKGVYELSSLNIFTAEEHVPLLGLAVFYYLLFLEFKDTEQIKLPCIYAPLYLYESLLYLVNIFLKQKETQLHMRGLQLAKFMLNMLNEHLVHIPANYLDIPLHREFCHSLVTIIAYTEPVEVRRLALQTLDSYIQQFDEEGRFIILKALMNTVTHNSLMGHLAILYKNLVGQSLKEHALPTSFHLQDFRHVMLKNICKLPQGVETDLISYANQVISALNTLIYFALSDHNNLTGFWSFTHEIEEKFLANLRTALNFSISHYKQEIKQLHENGLPKISEEERKQLEILQVTCGTDKDVCNELDVEQKINLLEQHLTTFDLISHLLGYVTTLLKPN